MAMIETDAGQIAEKTVKPQGYWSGVRSRLMRDPLTVLCLAVILALILSAIFAPWLGLADPYKGSMIARLKPIGTEGYPLGTDEQGRDMLARLIYGGRLTLFIGLMPVVLAFFIGSFLGIVIMRTVDVFFAFPSVLLAIAISGALGAGIVNSLVSLTIVFIPPLTRVAEAVTSGVRALDYIDAARATGASAWTVIRVHVIGNVLSPIFVYASSLTSVCMILAAGLSFLGIGVRPPEPEWGLMLNTLRSAIYVNPWISALPGLMIFITSLSLNLLSDGLRSAMNVRD